MNVLQQNPPAVKTKKQRRLVGCLFASVAEEFNSGHQLAVRAGLELTAKRHAVYVFGL